MYAVYLDKQLIHDLDSEDNVLVNPTLNLELNKAGTFEFSMECTHPFYDKMERFKSIIQVLCDGDEIFKGRIIEITDDMYKERKVYCESELAYLNDTIQRPYEYHLAASAVYEYLQAVIGSHNGQVDSTRTFTLGEITVYDPNDYIYCYTNYNTTMDEIKEDLVDDLGGYIRVRNEYSNNNPLGTLTGRYLDYINLEEYGRTSEQYIEFGENLLDFTNDINQADICTGIIPLGATLEESEYAAIDERVTIESVNSGSDYIVIPEAVEKYGLILKVVIWDDITEPKNLLSAAESYLAEYDYEPQTITATAVDMHLTDEEIESWRLGDKIFVESAPHDLHKRFPLAQMSIPLDQPENTSVTLGTYEDTSLSGRNNRTETGLRNFENFEVGNVIASAVARATAIIDQHTNGYVTIHYDEERGCADEILIMDAPNTEDATRVWRWNLNGLGYSSTGYSGDDAAYGTAITMDGWILGTFIIANGMILADDKDATFGKFNDQGMQIYQQTGRDDLILLSVGPDGLKAYNTAGTVLAHLNTLGLRMYRSSGVISSSLDADSFDTYDSDGVTLMSLDEIGAHYFYSGTEVGNIGTNYWTGYENNRGLSFDLETSAAYMAWSWKETESAENYTVKLAYHTKNSSLSQGIHFGDAVFLRGYDFYFGSDTSGGYVTSASNGVTFRGATYFFHDCTLRYDGYEVLNENSETTIAIKNGNTTANDTDNFANGWEVDISSLFSDYATQKWVQDQGYVTGSSGDFVGKSDTTTIKVTEGYYTNNFDFSFANGATLDISGALNNYATRYPLTVNVTTSSSYSTSGSASAFGGTINLNISSLLPSTTEASTAEKLKTGRLISLTFSGATFGSATFDGSENVYIPIDSLLEKSLTFSGSDRFTQDLRVSGDYGSIYLSGQLTNVETGEIDAAGIHDNVRGLFTFKSGSVSVSAGTRNTLYLGAIDGWTGSTYVGASGGHTYIQGTTNLSTLSVGFGSDKSLKKDIATLGVEASPIKKLDELEPVSFRLKDGDDESLHYGYIAQDVQEVLPDLIVENIISESAEAICGDSGTESAKTDAKTDTEEAILGIRYIEIIPLLHMKIKDQQATIESLEERIEKLEAIIYGEKERD